MFAPAKNTEIWEYAGENDLLIVTCDEDFFNLSSVRGFPPEIIMLGTGNRGRRYIEQPLIKMKSRIEEFIASADYGILEIL
jgi:predicted nuclease of predicted toxin-antitoxin system